MAPDQVPPNNFPNTLVNCTIRQYAGGMTNTTDPRVVAAAKAWDKHMGDRYAPREVEELAGDVAVILAAADAVDPRKPRTITTVEELDALAEGSVVAGDWATHQLILGQWATFGSPATSQPELPATVLWEPEA